MNSNYYNMINQYYGHNDINFKNNSQQFNSGEIITLNQAIDLIKKSVGDEREDELFYDRLISQAPSERDKNILRSIRNDERKHNQILRRLYYEFTGQNLVTDNSINSLSDNMNYKMGLEKALFGELEAVVKYRRIMGSMPSGNSYTLLMSIMTDELRHASQYNFLISQIN